MRALSWLKSATSSRAGKARTLLAALAPGADDAEAMRRMELQQPRGFGARTQARLLRLALAKTAR